MNQTFFRFDGLKAAIFDFFDHFAMAEQAVNTDIITK